MFYLDETKTREALAYPALIDALAICFASDCVMPCAIIMGWRARRGRSHASAHAGLGARFLYGLKMVSVFPGNGSAACRPSPDHLLSDGRTGALLAIVDGAS